ncbi:glutamate synthase-related protein [Candidatus Thiodiazotropha endoloripes]|nr:glutamate synthase-related protein [Candidatus Thiodiazotropha endoloripes]
MACLGMCACYTSNCPVGIATQKTELRQRLKIEKGAGQLNNFFRASTELMQVMARACGHDHLNGFSLDDLTTFDREMAHLTGIAYAGVYSG